MVDVLGWWAWRPDEFRSTAGRVRDQVQERAHRRRDLEGLSPRGLRGSVASVWRMWRWKRPSRYALTCWDTGCGGCSTTHIVRLLTGNPRSQAAAARAALDRAGDHGVRIWPRCCRRQARVGADVRVRAWSGGSGRRARAHPRPSGGRGRGRAAPPRRAPRLRPGASRRHRRLPRRSRTRGRGRRRSLVRPWLRRAEGVVRIDPAALGPDSAQQGRAPATR